MDTNLKFFGNENAMQIMNNAINTNRVSHAYLVFGDSGLGKKTFAKLFAMAIECHSENKPCGICSSCKKVLSSNHPDIITYTSSGSKNSFHVNVVREICADAYIKPNEGNKKIYIINNAHTMTIGAYNAFLKTLEEPPTHAVFILTCDNKTLIPETILSRLVAIPLYPVDTQTCVSALKAYSPDTEEQQLLHKAILSGGNIGNALVLLNEEDKSELSELSLLIINCIINKNEFDLLEAVAKLDANAQNLMAICDLCISHVSNAIKYKAGASISEANISSNISNLAQNLTTKRLFDLLDVFTFTKEFINSNVNKNITTAWFSSQIMLKSL